jgi:hypothetical protein
VTRVVVRDFDREFADLDNELSGFPQLLLVDHRRDTRSNFFLKIVSQHVGG